MSDWTLDYTDFDNAEEGLREALCTLGNGYFATRGAAEEAKADEIHYPGTYLAGGYNRLETEIAGREIENEDLVNMPNWLCLSFRHEGEDEWFDLAAVEILGYHQALDLRNGVLQRKMRFRDRQGRETSLVCQRLVHMQNPHLAAIQWQLTAENWSGRITVCSALDGRVINSGVARYRELASTHLRPLGSEAIDDDSIRLRVETSQSNLRVAQAARTQVFEAGCLLPDQRRLEQQRGYIAHELSFDVSQGRDIHIEKVVALQTSRDRAISEPGLAAMYTLAEAGRFADLLASHAQVWRHLWHRCDLILKGGGRTQMILRLHIFHLLQTVSPHVVDLDVGVPARGLHGEAYRGHIFWDELFIFPFLNLRIPEITRALLRYRYRRLGEARRLAREAGYRGAMYPWQSGSNGREESQMLHLNPKSGRWVADNSHLQRHVNAAVAYNVWRYYEVTEDIEFLSYYGAELLVEIARFWASSAQWNAQRKRYDICRIMGPDEFHDQYPWADEPGVDNNAYTNVMVSWGLRRACEALEHIGTERRRELCETLSVSEQEISTWDSISRRLSIPFHDGVISQFEGYERLDEFDWKGYQEKYGDIHRLDRLLEAEGDTVNRYKASKQADVLMLFYLFSAQELGDLFHQLGYPFDPELISQSIHYYRQRTSHGSTLSRIVESWVLARLDRPRSLQLLNEALESDIADVQGGTTREGIHLGAMAGSVDLVQRGETGLVLRDGLLRLDPCLPEPLPGLQLRLRYHGRWVEITLEGHRMTLCVPEGGTKTLRLAVRDRAYSFEAGQRLEFQWQSDSGWQLVDPGETSSSPR
ncbi:glycosyl hydrolase family 65 protein [Halomonas sp. Bachu 37]|uniref:glycoside hydrolase family 65 protein n=1 Tax=Halomonas kashgarensis TaxID=3084920 RepID=UPI0032165060